MPGLGDCVPSSSGRCVLASTVRSESERWPQVPEAGGLAPEPTLAATNASEAAGQEPPTDGLSPPQLVVLGRLLSLMRPAALGQLLDSEASPPRRKQQPMASAERDYKVSTTLPAPSGEPAERVRQPPPSPCGP